MNKYCEETRKRNDEKRMPLYQAGLSDREIAAELNESVNAIRQWRSSRGLSPNKRGIGPIGGPEYEIDPEKRFYYDIGMTDIPEDAIESVKYVIDNMRCSSEKIRDMIRMRYIEGLPLREIGDHYGITREAVRTAIKRALGKMLQYDKKSILILKGGMENFEDAAKIYEEEKKKIVLEIAKEMMEERMDVRLNR